MALIQPPITGESRLILDGLLEKCRQEQERYLIEKNKEPVQLSLFRLARVTKRGDKS